MVYMNREDVEDFILCENDARINITEYDFDRLIHFRANGLPFICYTVKFQKEGFWLGGSYFNYKDVKSLKIDD